MAAERKPYVQAADLVRATTVVFMVAVHCTWYMAAGGRWVGSGAILSILHFTRESFMALTGFVLTYSLSGKTIRWIPMLWRRYRLVLFPYLIWSAAYMVLFHHFPSVGHFFLKYGRNLLDGGAWFHLYYLLVTMQFYLLLPLFLPLMQVARRRPWIVFAVALAFQLGLMAYDQYGVGHHPHGISRYTGEEVWTYTVYFIMGGIAAVHWPQVETWLRRHLRRVCWAAVGGALLMLAQFFWQTYRGHNMTAADSVLQPAMVPWAIAVIVLLAAVGVRYEGHRRRNPGRWPLVKLLADLSFGIYLAHPMLLQWWTNLLAAHGLYHPSYGGDALTVIVLVSATTAATWGITKTPISAWVIGRAALPPGVGKIGWRSPRTDP